jgi:hypothetical protein
LLVRNRFMRYWDCRNKMRVRKRKWKVVEQLLVSGTSVQNLLRNQGII